MTPTDPLSVPPPTDAKDSNETPVQENEVTENCQAASSSSDAPIPHENAREEPQVMVKRVFFKTVTYIGYDALSEIGLKDQGRVVKVLVESVIDETCPGASFHNMALGRKLMEYLMPCGISSLVLYLLRKCREKKAKGRDLERGWEQKAAWVVAYRLVRQAIIYRLFFRLGSKRYYFVTLVGLFCCFFKDEIFRDFFRLRKWPQYFSTSQGLWAVLRSIVYSAAFCLPLQRASKIFNHARRRANAKKFLFAIVFARAQAMKNTLASIAPVLLLKT